MRVLVALCLLTSACVSLPAGPGQVSSASYVGDRAYMSFSEVVVSVPDASVSTAYSNLHVGLAAIINPVSTTYFDSYDVERIVRRSEPRIGAGVLESVLDAGPLDAAALPALRNRVTADAQARFDGLFSKWKHSQDFNVELVVTSLYLTNGSVGREAASSRVWW